MSGSRSRHWKAGGLERSGRWDHHPPGIPEVFRGRSWRLISEGQGDMEGCTARRVVLGPDTAPVRLDDGPADRQAKADTFVLGGHERLEQAVDNFRADARTGIGDSQM